MANCTLLQEQLQRIEQEIQHVEASKKLYTPEAYKLLLQALGNIETMLRKEVANCLAG